MNFFIFLTIIAICHCRPQDGIQNSGVENDEKISYLPYYGGAKGQFLKVVESRNGTIISTQIVLGNEMPAEDQNQTEKPNIEDKKEITKEIRSIHETAQNIIKLQAAAKKNGQLSEAEEKQYNENLEQLNLAAKNLANFQESQAEEESDEFSRANLKFWFEQKKSKFWGKNSEEHKEETTSEDSAHVNSNENEETDDEDGVAINLPPDDASVAEAKPVGLAVAGAGGVAASKPVATAVVGPRGLAIAKPVATAIAGISPDDPMISLYVDGLIKFPDKKKDKIPDRENQNNKEICNDKAADKCDKDNKGDKGPKKEKPKLDYLSHYREGIFK